MIADCRLPIADFKTTARTFRRLNGSALVRLAAVTTQIRHEVDAMMEAARPADDGFKITPHHQQRAPARRKSRATVPTLDQRPRRGEIRMAKFVAAEARRCAVCAAVIYERLRCGRYPGVRVRKVGPHTQFVRVKSLTGTKPSVPRRGEMLLKKFVSGEAARLGQSLSAVYMRMRRGGYPGLRTRKVSSYWVFISGKPVRELQKHKAFA